MCGSLEIHLRRNIPSSVDGRGDRLRRNSDAPRNQSLGVRLDLAFDY